MNSQQLVILEVNIQLQQDIHQTPKYLWEGQRVLNSNPATLLPLLSHTNKPAQTLLHAIATLYAGMHCMVLGRQAEVVCQTVPFFVCSRQCHGEVFANCFSAESTLIVNITSYCSCTKKTI